MTLPRTPAGMTAGKLTGEHVGKVVKLKGKTHQELRGQLLEVTLRRNANVVGDTVKFEPPLEVSIKILFGDKAVGVDLPAWAPIEVED